MIKNNNNNDLDEDVATIFVSLLPPPPVTGAEMPNDPIFVPLESWSAYIKHNNIITDLSVISQYTILLYNYILNIPTYILHRS